jgi:translation initiation factor IF-2
LGEPDRLTGREVRPRVVEVRDTFKISKIGTIGGSYVTDGKVNRQAMIRLLRDNVVIHLVERAPSKPLRAIDGAC